MKYVILKTTVGDRQSFQRQLEPHRNYLESLIKDKSIVAAGKFDDRSGGMMIIEAPGLEQAIAIARRDPLVMAGVDRYQVRGWSPITSGSGTLDASGPPIKVTDTGPIQITLFEDTFKVIDAAEHPDHQFLMRQCFIPNEIDADDPSRKDYLRWATTRGLQKLLLLHQDVVAGQIEYAPPRISGLPIKGEGLAVINCIWVVDAYTGLEGGRQLLAACAERSGATALATVAYNATMSWLGRGFFERQDFVVVDQVETGRFFGDTPIVAYLLWRPLQPGLPPPTWNTDKLLAGVNFCPGYPWMLKKRLYWGRDFAYHGLLVKEGLRRPEVLDQLPCLGKLRSNRWTFIKFGVPDADLNRAIILIQSALIEEPTYYAHLYGKDRVVVIFPDRIFKLSRDPASWAEAIKYGESKGIPHREMNFIPTCAEDEEF